MKRFLLNIPMLTWGTLLLFVAALGYSHAQVVPQPGPPTPIACAYNTAPVTLTTGQAGWVQCDSSGALITSSGGAGTSAVNLTQVGGAAVALGQTVMASSIPVAIASNHTGISVIAAPSASSSSAATAASSTAAGSNLVIKASAGNLYGVTVTIGATSGYLMLFNATSLPSNGAVTPIYCIPVTSNGTNGYAAVNFPMPRRFGTGITAGFSTTGCFNLTASATASFFGDYQ